ncbi:Dynein light chain type 1 family protein [Abeliophyllum distichum]|uniref:Dynein light chain type 1 family protein n=1 Tax=Abeliophyllum distichum TaxID=126358 RepID=A0ABD1QU48_9LAMI
MAAYGENKKKANIYVYNMGTGNFKPESNYPATVKKSILPGWGLMRSKTYRESADRGGLKVAEGGGEVGAESRKSVSIIETRKSVSHVEVNAGSVATFLQVKVLVTDMPGFMQVHAFKCARRIYDSLEKFSPKHMAYNMKKEFDSVYGPAWHCIVGSSFGSFVTHSTGCFLYFSMENLYILVFKTKVQRALQ